MLRTVTIVPAILTASAEEYKAQVEKINTFTKRVQIDVVDGTLAPKSTQEINQLWWPQDWAADLHVMSAQPSQYLPVILQLKPSLCILHAETNENLLPLFEQVKAAGIKTGVALLPQTYPGAAKQYIDVVDHVLIFAGTLGQQGAPANMMQTEKVPLVRAIRPEVEIGWDGGANLQNLRALAHADLDVINVGSAISQAPDPAAAYAALVAEIDKNGVVL